MCLAVPGEIKKILDGGRAVADFMGVERVVALDLLESVRVGDYVIVHAGFAINRLNEEEARETIECFREIIEASD